MERTRHLRARGRTGGKTLWYWEPSASLRALGFLPRRLDDDPERAQREAQELNEESDLYRVRQAMGQFAGARPGTVRWLIAAYLAHDDYLLLAERTRDDYRRRLSIVSLKLGDARLRELSPRVVQALKRSLAPTPVQANRVCAVFRLLMSFGVREGFIASNPARSFKQYRERPRRQVWSHGEEARFLAVCGREIALAYLLAVYTAQRQGDVLRLPWSAYDGEVIRLRQGKTGAELEIPVAARLRRALDEAPRASPVICVRADGRPWAADHFRHVFARAVSRARLQDRRFQDLRRTAVVRLAEAGCTVPEVASITGHSMDTCHRIIERYLPRTRRLAAAAIAKLEDYRASES